jgi:hypothetical protein
MRNLSSTFRPLVKFIVRYNVIIFFLLISTGMGLSIYNLNTSMQNASKVTQPTTSSQQSLVNFNQYTSVVTLVEGLSSSANMPEASIPSGRINPFAE